MLLKKTKKLSYIIFFLICSYQSNANKQYSIDSLSNQIIPGAWQISKYKHILKGKNIGLVVNHTSLVKEKHLLDTLLSLDLKVKKVFAPEHGFKGLGDAGEVIMDKMIKKNIPIKSLYGKKKKPNSKDLEGLDIMVFDIQDVGVRFYTYISTLHLVMEACAENNLEILVLDRPNPNGHYVDGPVLDTSKYQSFIGMHPIPIVYGLTIGELAQMIIGESWLKTNMECQLKVIHCANYTHQSRYELPIKPSPNLPNARSIELYPSIGLFEGTVVSVGRGTPWPFQVLGDTSFKKNYSFEFIPQSLPGAKYPKYLNKNCFGIDLREIPKEIDEIDLGHLIELYNNHPNKKAFFNKNFNYLIGNSKVKQQIIDGKDEKYIKSAWKKELNNYLKTREKYRIYE